MDAMTGAQRAFATKNYMMRVPTVIFGIIFAGMILFAACGGDATATPSPTQNPAATVTPSPTPEPPPQPASTDYSTLTAELSQLIQSVVDEAGITGLSVALVDDQEIVWSEGFGFADKENGVKAGLRSCGG